MNDIEFYCVYFINLQILNSWQSGRKFWVKVMEYGEPYPLYVEMKKLDADGRKINIEEVLIDNKLVKKGYRER